VTQDNVPSGAQEEQMAAMGAKEHDMRKQWEYHVTKHRKQIDETRFRSLSLAAV
jgi:hypothetical protein